VERAAEIKLSKDEPQQNGEALYMTSLRQREGEQVAERGGVGVECTAARGVRAIEARGALR